jgi:hypothetical protein
MATRGIFHPGWWSWGQGDSIQSTRRCRLGESDIRFTEAPRNLVRGLSFWPAYSLGAPSHHCTPAPRGMRAGKVILGR